MRTIDVDQNRRESNRSANRVGLAYLGVGALWILLSDALVQAISIDPTWLQAAQRYKGLVYVLFTTLGLVFLIRRSYRHLLAERTKTAASDLQTQDLFLHHPNPMWVFDLASLRFLRVNDAALAQYGYTRAEFLAMTVHDIRPAEEVPTFLASLQPHNLREGHRVRGTFLHHQKNGELLYARITEHTIELDGRHASMVMAENVTKEVRLHRALERQQAQFHQLHQSLGEVLWMASADGQKMLYVSPAFEALYGRNVAELQNHPALWFEVVHPEDRASVLAIERGPAHAPASVCQYRIIRPDGTVRWIEDRKKLIHDDDGQVLMMGGIAEDITMRKERDEARAQLNTQLEKLVAERTQALAQANLELDAFSRTAAHDLKNPLNGIIGLSQLLRLQCGAAMGEQGERYTRQIEGAARDMTQLINDLLSLSRAGSIELARQTIDLAPLAQSLVAELRRQEPERQVDVIMPPTLEAYCDAGLMRSLLQNLIGNAWKFSAQRADARITLALRTQAGHTCLTVADNGAGFDSTRASPQFRPFERFHTQTQFQGTGLGLVTCQRIAHRHGGELTVDSTPGVGTTVTVSLPLAPCSQPSLEAVV